MYAITFTSILIILLTNVYAQSSSKYLRISPYGEPSYVYTSKILISCSYSSTEEMQKGSKLRWRYEDGQIIDDEHLQSSSKTLTIKFADFKLKEGNYTCEYVTNDNNNELITDKISVSVKFAKEPTYENCPKIQYLIKNDTNAMINCEIYTLPTAQVEWRKGDKELDKIDNRDYYSINSKGIKILKPIDNEISGTYRILLNVFETGLFYSHDIDIIIVDKPIINNIKYDLPYLIDGKETRVECVGETNLNPQPRYYWFAAKRNLSDPGNENYQVNVDTGELIIKTGIQKDEGNFTCVAINEFGREEKSIQLYYASKPEFIVDEQKQTNEIKVLLGSTAELECEIKFSNLPINLTIRKEYDNEINMINENRLVETIINKTDRYVITAKIATTIKTDSGKYECIAESVGGVIKREITLITLYEPILKTVKSPVKMYGTMYAVNLTCEVDANPKANIEWYFDNKQKIINSDKEKRFKIYYGDNQDISYLEVHRHPGEYVFYVYQCIATNIVLGENKQRSIDIKLEEAFAPSSVVVSKNEQNVKQRQVILHVESVNDGGLPLQEYLVKIIDNNNVTNERISNNHPVNKNNDIVLNDLQPNKTYSIRVAAINEAGTGEYGQEIIVHTLPETVPDSPQFIIDNKNDGDIISEYSDEYTVTWSLPDDNGAPITFYDIKYYKVIRSEKNINEFEQLDTFKEAVISGNDALSYRLTSLDPNSYYKVEIQAKNIKGKSKANYLVFRTSPGVINSDDNIETRPSTSYSVIALVSIILVIVLILAIIVDIVISINCGIGLSHVLCPQLFNSSSMASKGDDVNISNNHHKVINEEQTPMMEKSSDTKLHKDSAV